MYISATDSKSPTGNGFHIRSVHLNYTILYSKIPKPNTIHSKVMI